MAIDWSVSRSATTLSFETPAGGVTLTTTPLPGRVMENALPGRGLTFLQTMFT